MCYRQANCENVGKSNINVLNVNYRTKCSQGTLKISNQLVCVPYGQLPGQEKKLQMVAENQRLIQNNIFWFLFTYSFNSISAISNFFLKSKKEEAP